MPDRIMFVQMKTGYDTDQGPAWISVVRFNRTWKTAYWRGKTLRRRPGMFDANFFDTDTEEGYWISGPHRDGGDTRYSSIEPTVEENAREAYEAFWSLGACEFSYGSTRGSNSAVVTSSGVGPTCRGQ